jgi:hypothetical protein
MSISSIDELLMGGGTPQQPQTPEHQQDDGPAEIEELEPDVPDYGDDEPETDEGDHTNEPDDAQDEGDESHDEHTKEYDEYGNEKAPPRMYTEEEHKELLNKAIRERFERFQRNNPDVAPVVTQQQVQSQTKNFEFNPDSDQNLAQQLESFIEQTVTNMTSKRDTAERAQKEQEIQAEFEEKLVSGMNKFKDFRDVVGQYEITNPMTLATRAMQDPAAFLYAAAKRHPQELERIAKLRDPYAQMTEMGKLEERMRRNKPTTKAPRPLGRTAEDATIRPPAKKAKEPTNGDDLLARADAKRLAQVKTRLKGNR